MVRWEYTRHGKNRPSRDPNHYTARNETFHASSVTKVETKRGEAETNVLARDLKFLPATVVPRDTPRPPTIHAQQGTPHIRSQWRITTVLT